MGQRWPIALRLPILGLLALPLGVASLGGAAPALAEPITGTSPGSRGDFLIVVHPENPLDWITRSQLSDIFLGKVSVWDSGERIALVEPHGKSDLRFDFAVEIHDRSVESVRRLWLRLLTTGRQRPPHQTANDAELVAWVAQRPGAVGYVSRSAELGGVKVLGLVGEPELIDSIRPVYTDAAVQARVEGTVLLEVEVDERGRVADVQTVRGLPHGLTHQAVRAVRRFKYRPAEHQGKPVPTRIEVAVRFRL